jgi:hypothetical protein
VKDALDSCICMHVHVCTRNATRNPHARMRFICTEIVSRQRISLTHKTRSHQQKVASKEIEPNAEQKDKLAKRGELEAEIQALEKELASL